MRKRLDVLLVERGLFTSREQAQRAVLAGRVLLAGRCLDKPGHQLPEDAADLVVREEQPGYVSRGGDKLAGAFDFFRLDAAGLICLDLGASTGGFTDCLLQRGASRVFAVDVGRGQLAWKLRQDPRVLVKEGVNARYLKPEDLPEPPDLITIDVSFISLRLVLPAAAAVLKANGQIVALIKPQFEAGRAQVGKRGVVRSPEVHQTVLAGVLAAAMKNGLALRGLTHSTLKGPRGNIEFFGWWGRGSDSEDRVELIRNVVERAHTELG